MKMIESISFQPKSISRILAIISAICGCISIIKHFMKITVPSIQGHNIQMMAFGVIYMFLIGGIYFGLAFFLWQHNDSKYIRFWAMLPCVILFRPIARLFGFIVYILLNTFLTDTEAKMLSSSCVLFFGLLSVGIIYLFLKRLLFHVHNRNEVVDIKTLKASRYTYFCFLTYTFWAMVIGACLSTTKIATNLENHSPILILMAFIIGSILSFGFFMSCRYCFVTKPAKVLQQNQPCS